MPHPHRVAQGRIRAAWAPPGRQSTAATRNAQQPWRTPSWTARADGDILSRMTSSSHDFSSVDRDSLPLVEELVSAGFSMAPGSGSEQALADEWRVEARGGRAIGRFAAEALVGSVFWRVGARSPRLAIRLDGLPIAGQATIAPRHWEMPVIAKLFRHGEPRHEVGDRELDARFRIASPSLEEAQQALPEALRRVLVAHAADPLSIPEQKDASLELSLRVTPGQIVLYPEHRFEFTENRHLVKPTIAVAEALAAAFAG